MESQMRARMMAYSLYTLLCHPLPPRHTQYLPAPFVGGCGQRSTSWEPTGPRTSRKCHTRNRPAPWNTSAATRLLVPHFTLSTRLPQRRDAIPAFLCSWILAVRRCVLHLSRTVAFEVLPFSGCAVQIRTTYDGS